MTRFLMAATLMIGFQFAHAEDAAKTAKAPEAKPVAADSQSKSFFESRSLEDMQKIVNLDSQFANELESSQAPGNG